MRRLSLTGSILLIGTLTIAGCKGPSAGTPQARETDAASVPAAPANESSDPGASAPSDAVPGRGAALAATIPDVPAAVQIIAENGNYVLRTTADDKPLYIYDKDTLGASNCNDGCATAWPPLAAPSGARAVGTWTVVTRADGAHQWAYAGKPVYTFARDTEARSSGDGTSGVWHLLPAIPAK